MNNIKKFRQKSGMKQIELCRYVGVTQGALSGWENGKFDPDIKSLNKMADLFDVTIDELLGNPPRNRKGVRIPVYGNVAAGIPIEAITDIEDFEEITPELAVTGEYIALRIHGDSMEPRMTNGDVVIVRLQEDVDNGETAIVLINGNDATCKKIKKMPDGILLISNNPAYDPMFYSNAQIVELPVRIIGKVVELRAKF